MSPHTKPATLLRLMTERQGQRITARDVAALQLAAATLDEQAAQLDKHFSAYGDVLREVVINKARAEALQEGIRALLEVHQ